MKFALIPPFRYMDTLSDPYHLILPQNLDNLAYCAAYQECRRSGDYIILDNGAAEGLHYTAVQLHQLAHIHKVNEIVVHDVMHDVDETIKAVQAFQPHVSKHFNYMVVLQGTTIDECVRLIEFYLKEVPWFRSFGIPRHLITTCNSDDTRLRLVEAIRDYDDVGHDIHLLGTSPDYIGELDDYGKHFRRLGVRGVDTSAPYNYAYEQKWIGDREIVVRPRDYFTKVVDLRTLKQNIATMKEWVHG